MKQAKTRRANGKVYYKNSHAQFHVPMNQEGFDFIRLAQKFLNPEHCRMWTKYRGPHRPSSDTKFADANQMAVYLRVKSIPQTTQRIYRFWFAEAQRRKAAGQDKSKWRKCPDTGSYYPAMKFIAECANVTMRMAMILCYGLDRYMVDANAAVIDRVVTRKGQTYQLLSMRLEEESFTTPRTIVALEMKCPSTGAVYIHPVPPDIERVTLALDWMFDVTNYLGTVGAES